MKILLIAPQPFMAKRGTPLAVYQLLRALGELGHRVDLITYHLGEPVDISGVRHHRTWRIPFIRSVKKGHSLAKVALDVLVFLKALGLLVRGRYDCIHAVEEGAIMGGLFKAVFRCPLVYDMDSSIPEQLDDARSPFWSSRLMVTLAARLERWTVSRADLVIAVCGSLAERAKRSAADTSVVILEDIPTAAPYSPAMAGDLERLRGEFGVKGERIILYTGTFEAYQGIDLLLRAVAIVVREFPAARFLLVGGEPDQVREKRGEAEALGIGDAVVILGKRPLEEMPLFMEMADILVSPRDRGTNTPMKIYTYLQSGRPIVATRLATHTQVLSDETSLLVSPDPSALAAGICTLLGDEARRATLGAAGKRLVEERYSYAGFKLKVKEAYALIQP